MSGPQPPTEDTSRWTPPDYCWHSRRSLADEMRDVLAAADLTIHVDLWHRPFDPFAKGAPWWQWRTPCDCPDTEFGRNPHRWNCFLTPTWAQTMRDLDTNPWTVVENAIRIIPQIEAWRRDREAHQALIDYAVAMGIALCCDQLSMILGVDATDWAAADAAELRYMDALRAAHPLTLASEWGGHTELDYYDGGS